MGRLNVPRDLALGDRAKVLEQLGVNRPAHAAVVGVVKDVLPESQVGLLVGARRWPLFAARMDRIRDQGGPARLGAHLARLHADTALRPGTARVRVSRAAARSTTTRTRRAPGSWP